MARFFLYAPKTLGTEQVIACAKAACAAGDCASIIVHASASKEDVAALQELNLAVLVTDVEPRDVAHRKADGIHLANSEHNLLDLRLSLPKDAMIGLECGTSRHAAMEAAEQGADYVCFSQKAQTTGEPLITWWNELAEIPGVPLDPSSPAEAMILAQYADFIRPSDDMWQGPDMATKIIASLNDSLK